MNSKRAFFESLVHSAKFFQRDAPGDATERVAPGDTERRRRFLLRALAGGVGLVALRNSGLAAAIQQNPVGGGPKSCTTTVSYTTSYADPLSFPSNRSRSLSGTELCYPVDYTASETRVQSWSDSYTFASAGTSNGSTYYSLGTFGETYPLAGTSTGSTMCVNGTESWSVSYPSYASYVWIRTTSAKVTLTINVPCKAPDGDDDGSFSRPDLPKFVPPTIDAARPVHDPRSRSARDFRIDFGGRA